MPTHKPSEPILEVRDAAGWRRWLAKNYASAGAVYLRIPKKPGSGGGRSKGSLTYEDALDAALAWGWIDSRKRSSDERSWLQRFGPRSARSPWSKINRERAEALVAAGRMEAPGAAEVERARRDGRWDRAYDGARVSTVPEDLGAALEAAPRALAFFRTLDAANRYAILHRVQTASKPATRAARIRRYVDMCDRGDTIHPARTAKPRPSKRATGDAHAGGTPMAYVALLRAVNVGGTGKIAMTDLSDICRGLGFQDVRTYIASGNVVFRSRAADPEVKQALEAALERHMGKPVPVIVRSARQMADVVARNPFAGRPANHTYAYFLDAPPARAALTDVKHKADEVLKLGEREIYVYYPSGMGRSRLVIPAAREGTARNMNTVARLAEMAREASGARSTA